jgi:O-antigen ligase
MGDFEDPNQWLLLIPGIRINDIILGAMFIALGIRLGSLAFHKGLRKGGIWHPQKKWLTCLIFGFGLWLIFEIIRNFHIYGLSSPGEFRSHYLILVLPLYVTVFFDTPKKRTQFFKSLVFFCLFLPLLSLPVIVALNGWEMRQQYHFFPASISFGILLGFFSYITANQYQTIKRPLIMIWPALLAALLVILFDSHRSVWFPGLILMVLVFKMNQDRSLDLFKTIGYLALIAATLMVASAIASSVLDKNLFDFVLERGGELFQLNETYNTTWTWRIAKWKEQLLRVAATPFTGIGFGGYWGLSELPGDVGISPHNLYVLILVKLGLIGLGLYLGIIFLVFGQLSHGLNLLKKNQDPESVVLISGITALIGSHIYGLAYAFNDYSLIYIGLAMAVVRHKFKESIDYVH